MCEFSFDGFWNLRQVAEYFLLRQELVYSCLRFYQKGPQVLVKHRWLPLFIIQPVDSSQAYPERVKPTHKCHYLPLPLLLNHLSVHPGKHPSLPSLNFLSMCLSPLCPSTHIHSIDIYIHSSFIGHKPVRGIPREVLRVKPSPWEVLTV